MSFVQNFPLFAIILSLVCAVISFAANDRWARGLTLFLLSVSVCMQAALLVFCAVNGTSYSYMMGHYPAPWGNEITVGVLESFMALLFAAVMLMSVLGGMPRIRRDIPEHRMRLYWVMIDHGGGLYTVYMHCSSLAVSEGTAVSAGQTIAYVGSTGISTGNHLHFGVSLNGSYVSPWSYLKG